MPVNVAQYLKLDEQRISQINCHLFDGPSVRLQAAQTYTVLPHTVTATVLDQDDNDVVHLLLSHTESTMTSPNVPQYTIDTRNATEGTPLGLGASATLDSPDGIGRPASAKHHEERRCCTSERRRRGVPDRG